MRKLSVALVLLSFVVAPGLARADLEVVTTVPDLAAIARAIGGERVSVKSLSLHTQDPHWVDAKPSLAIAVNRADILLAVGLSLEVGWLPTLQTGSRNPKIGSAGSGFLACSSAVDLLEVPTGPVSRSMGDVHPGGNPHYLYDPRRALVCARSVAAKMAEVDPDSAAHYRAGLAAFEAELDRRMVDWERRLAKARGRTVVTYHRSFVYLANWLGLKIVATLEPKPGIPPSPSHVAKVLVAARRANVGALLQEGYYPSKTSSLVAEKIGARLVNLHGGTDFRGGETYLDHIEETVAAIEKALVK